VAGDLTNTDDRERVLAAALDRFGRIDILVNNGGGPVPGSALEVDAQRAHNALELLLVPTMHLSSICLPHLQQSGAGRIVNIQSSSVREPIPGLALSNAIRPGVVGWTKTFAREVARFAITVNTIAPGRIATARLKAVYGEAPDVSDIPAGRLGRPEEVAAVACFLASPEASYITGTVVPVDGGLSRYLL
jgi:3-oxoacyl-[acyl-carrier protein] reductase